jgi:hypothetical protein
MLSESQVITALVIPIAVYVIGRMSESSIRGIYANLRGDLRFRHLKEGDSASLILTTRNPVYLDELQIHLANKLVDVVESLKKKMSFQPHQRIQMSPLDRLEFECVIQKSGDKSLFVHAYLGTLFETFEESISTEAKSAVDFMRRTDITITASSRTYRRPLFKRARDRFSRDLSTTS